MSELSKITLYIINFNICLLFVLFFSKSSFSENFLECIEDVPIDIDYKENSEECFNFDSDTGRIVLAQARTLMKPTLIIEYYIKILPSFGWNIKQLLNDDKFLILTRERDVLKISIEVLENDSSIISYNLLSLIK